MTAQPREEEPGGRDRDEEFSRFYRDSAEPLVRRCIRLGVPPADAPGIVQELMAEIYRRWTEIASAQAYANFTVACRAADYLKLFSRTVPSDSPDFMHLGQPLTQGLPDGILLIEGEQLVLEALSQLPRFQRAVFALVYDGYDTDDIAAILKLKAATVRSHLRHARITLRAWWSGRSPESTERGHP